MVEPINYAAILASGRNLVPDYAAEAMRKQALGIQQQQADTNQAQEQRIQDDDQRKIKRRETFSGLFDRWAADPTEEGAIRLAGAFPEFHQVAKTVGDKVVERQRLADRTQLGQAFAGLVNNRPDLTLETFRTRRDADAKAGQDTTAEDAIIEMLESDDPLQHQRARGMIAYELAGTMGEPHFASALDKLLSSFEPPDFEKYADSLGLERDTPEWKTALKDYVLRGSGPTAHGYDVALEGQRQSNRVALATKKENLVRGRPAKAAPPRSNRAPTKSTVVGTILAKQARGQALTPGEQQVIEQHGGGKVYEDGTVMELRDGTRKVKKNGRWVDEV